MIISIEKDLQLFTPFILLAWEYQLCIQKYFFIRQRSVYLLSEPSHWDDKIYTHPQKTFIII